MMRKKAQRKGTKVENVAWVRASISFPADIHGTLENIAREKKVSLAWVVRDAAEKYVSHQRRVQKKN